MKSVALLIIAIVLSGCGAGKTATSSPLPSGASPSITATAIPSSVVSPSPQASPTVAAPILRLIYRTYDGNQYGLAAANAERLRLIDPRTKAVVPVSTALGFVELLGSIIS